ncbi:BQ5605_C004g02922 [Microbotryum silenes-dioicae]|uniref:BQ5605_C004g02922 protein n=1 Tax=Microbotryum silenes-dioicae TaxID=796604 RepID=A0A2X0MWB5_9BASI|nr:BQ5605_C004g02922 [Microbotryum silenes-dioicae]
MAYHFVLVTPSNSSSTLPQTLELIQALATYEKEPDAVEATLPLLRRSLFGEEGKGEEGKGGKYAQCVLVYEEEEGDSKPLGMAVWFYTFSTWTGKGGLYLEDLFVREEARGKGVGKALFKYLGQICKDKDLARMDWVVLDWNEPAKKVYQAMGAQHASSSRRLELS